MNFNEDRLARINLEFQWSLGWMLRSVITCNGFFWLRWAWWSELIIWNGNTWLSSSSAKLTPISCLANRTLKWVSASYCTTNIPSPSLSNLFLHSMLSSELAQRKRVAHCLAHLPTSTSPTQDPNRLGMIARNRTCFGVYVMASANRLSQLPIIIITVPTAWWICDLNSIFAPR